jgi:DTW domain-containing protein YfiP
MYKSTKSNEVPEALQRKIPFFNIHHHPTVLDSVSRHLKGFASQLVDIRCKDCWLRKHDCYCSYLANRKDVYRESLRTIHEQVDVMMYYFYLEIGRSANTGHLFELLSDHCSRVIFGDSASEIELFNRMKDDYDQGIHSYCILYPTSGSMTMSEWVNTRTTTNPKKPITLIALDGTYAKALRQFKHLKKVAALMKFPLPVVKLDIGENGMKSAVLELMHQPSKEKICTFQAVVMALEEFGLEKSTSLSLNEDLTKWIEHIVSRKIKTGKEKMKLPLGLVIAREDDNTSCDEDDDHKSIYHDTATISSRNEIVMTRIYDDNWKSAYDVFKSMHMPAFEPAKLIIRKTAKFAVLDLSGNRKMR